MPLGIVLIAEKQNALAVTECSCKLFYKLSFVLNVITEKRNSSIKGYFVTYLNGPSLYRHRPDY